MMVTKLFWMICNVMIMCNKSTKTQKISTTLFLYLYGCCFQWHHLKASGQCLGQFLWCVYVMESYIVSFFQAYCNLFDYMIHVANWDTVHGFCFTFKNSIMAVSLPLWSFWKIFWSLWYTCVTVIPYMEFFEPSIAVSWSMYTIMVIPEISLCIGNCDAVHEIISYLPEQCHGWS